MHIAANSKLQTGGFQYLNADGMYKFDDQSLGALLEFVSDVIIKDPMS